MMIYIRRIANGEVVKELPCDAVIGTSNYERALKGLYAKVNLDEFIIDHQKADAEHEAIRGAVIDVEEKLLRSPHRKRKGRRHGTT